MLKKLFGAFMVLIIAEILRTFLSLTYYYGSFPILLWGSYAYLIYALWEEKEFNKLFVATIVFASIFIFANIPYSMQSMGFFDPSFNHFYGKILSNILNVTYLLLHLTLLIGLRSEFRRKKIDTKNFFKYMPLLLVVYSILFFVFTIVRFPTIQLPIDPVNGVSIYWFLVAESIKIFYCYLMIRMLDQKNIKGVKLHYRKTLTQKDNKVE